MNTAKLSPEVLPVDVQITLLPETVEKQHYDAEILAARCVNGVTYASLYEALRAIADRQNQLIASSGDGTVPTELIDLRKNLWLIDYGTASARVSFTETFLEDVFLHSFTDADTAEITPTYVEDYYRNAAGQAVVTAGWKYTAPIPVRIGETYKIYTRGYLNNVAIVSRCNVAGGGVTPEIVSSDSGYHVFVYPVTESGYITICGYSALLKIVKCEKKPNEAELKTAMGAFECYRLAQGNSYTVPAFTSQIGYYNSELQLITDNPDYSYTTPILLTRGQTLAAKLYGYRTGVSVLTRCDESGNPLKVCATASSYQDVSVTAREEQEWYIVSYQNWELNHLYVCVYTGNLIGSGKVWIAFGDSITERNGYASERYCDYIAEELGLNLLNYGESGSGFLRSDPYYARIQRMDEDFDVMTVMGSFNDLNPAYGLPLGVPTDSETSTLCGAMNAAVNAFYTKYPDQKLAFITPIPWRNYYNSSLCESTEMENYANAMKAVAARNGIPCLDLYHESGLRPWLESHRALYYKNDLTNGVHPSSEGHKYVAPLIRGFVQSLL